MYEDLFWNRGTLQLRSGLFYFSFPTFDLGILEIEMISVDHVLLWNSENHEKQIYVWNDIT